MSEVKTSIENQKVPESLSFTPLLGLQGRLAIGGNALLPSQHVELKTGIDRVNEPATIALMDSASIRERNRYWKMQGEQTKEEQLSLWKKSVVEKITAIPTSSLTKDHVDFFTKMGINVEGFTEKDAQELYNAYFAKDKQGQGIHLFIDAVITAYKTNTGGTDVAALKTHLPALQWMAGMFGGNSSELIAQLLDAKIDNQADETIFVQQRKDKVNDLTEREKELLVFLIDGSVAQNKPELVVQTASEFVPPHISFEQNLQGAQEFCDKLRKRMIDNQQTVANNQMKFTDPKTGVTIYAPNATHFEQNGMHDYDFIQWVEQKKQNNFPITLLTTQLAAPILHSNLLLSSPKLRNGQYYITYYDPYSASEQEATLQGLRPFDVFKTEQMKTLSEKGDHYEIAITASDGSTYSSRIPKSKLNVYLVDKWLHLDTATRGKFFMPSMSETAAQAIIDGTYDLTLSNDQELPNELKYGKMGRFQYTPSDCLPLSFYAGVLRYLAKPGEQLAKLRLAKQIKKDWDVSILTRNELIGLKDQDPRINNLYKKQFTFGNDPQPFTVVDAYTNTSKRKTIVLYRESDDQAKEIPFEDLVKDTK